MHVGDRIRFNIQGIPITARIASIRTRARESLKPFFYFVLQPKTLEKAPQTIFTAVRVDKARIAELQNRVVAQFPNVSVIDITETATVFSHIMERLSTIVRFFALFSIAAGLLIMISTIFATRAARVRESVYYKILGATRGFVLKVYTLENAFLGGISAVIAMIVAQTAGFLICARYLEIHYRWFPLETAGLLVVPLVIVIGVGLTASRSILSQKPISYLREHGL